MTSDFDRNALLDAKAKAFEEVCNQQAAAVASVGACANATYRPSLREQAEENVGYHRDQADKHDRAAAFFRENPTFDEFVQLVRSGVIQI